MSKYIDVDLYDEHTVIFDDREVTKGSPFSIGEVAWVLHPDDYMDLVLGCDEIVRCEDCKYCTYSISERRKDGTEVDRWSCSKLGETSYGKAVSKDFYCAYGERK